MRRFVTIVTMGLLVACGGSSNDFCKQGVSVLQSEDAKIKSCGDSANEEAAESLAASAVTTAQNDEASCETSLKSCTSADMNVLSSFIACEQAVVASIQCVWFTEADPTTDASYQKFLSDDMACGAMLNSLSAACAGTD
jgi:hypothetical protein